MGVLRPLLVVCSALFLAAVVSAQSTPSPPATSDPQAVALIQKSLAALTSGATVTDATLTGTAQRIAGSDNETGTATLQATSLGDSAVTMNFTSGVRTEIRNHSAIPLAASLPPGITPPPAATSIPQPVGSWSGPDGVVHAVAADNIMTEPTWFEPVLTLTRLMAPGQSWILSYVGAETHDGLAVVHVQATQIPPAAANAQANVVSLIQRLSLMDIYLDASTLLPDALDFNAHPDNNALTDIPTEIQFTNYRSVSGIEVPYRVQKYVNNVLSLDLQFSSANFNSGVSASVFAMQ